MRTSPTLEPMFETGPDAVVADRSGLRIDDDNYGEIEVNQA